MLVFNIGEMKKILYLSIAALILVSCRAAKKIQQPVSGPPKDTVTVRPRADSVSTTPNLSGLNRIKYQTFSGRAEVDFTQDGGRKNNFDIKVNMLRDSIIWFSATGPLGIEGMRGIITRDSVKIINRLNREYIQRSISYLQEQLGLPLDLASMQDLLIGNPVFINNDSSRIVQNGQGWLITSEDRGIRNQLLVTNPGLLPSFSKLDAIDSSKKKSAELSYSDYHPEGNASFSTLRNILIKFKTNLTIQLHFGKYNFNHEISAPFAIPKGFKVK
jgi:hypothetical protein